MQPNSRPRRKASVVQRALGTEGMLYDPEGDKVVRLNGTARRIWEMCSGERTLDAIAAALRDELVVEPGTDVLKDVADAVVLFANAGLLADRTARMPAP
jgi:pyrroloquinoline quinone biosynthesis protein D